MVAADAVAAQVVVHGEVSEVGLVTSGDSGQRLSRGQRHPELLQGTARAVEQGPGGGVVAVLLGDDGRGR